MLFLNPFLLGGLILASVPVIIHLLNRRRFQRVDWAPMKYLKLTVKSNRRRLRFEQLILLALRTLVILLLILAVARPLLSNAGAAWLPGHERASRIFVFDNSLSMSYIDGGRPALDAAKEAARALITADAARDSATILTTAQDEPLLREAPMDSSKVTDAIAGVTLSDTRSDWPAAFRQIDRALGVATFPTREVLLFTDLRSAGWGDVNAIAKQWAEQNVKLRVIDVGSRRTDNVALVSLEQEQRIALANEPVRLRAQIRNDTPALVTGMSAVFTVGSDAGKSDRPVQLPDLPPGQTADVPLTFTPTKPGQLPVRLAIKSDSLPRDDVRDWMLDVKSTLNVSLVDGKPSAKPFESATDFLSLAFSLGASPWTIAKQSESEWNAARAMNDADAYVLADVATPSATRVAELEKLVRGGASLMIFVGDNTEIGTYNDRLYANGKGLLPAKLTGVADAPATGLVIEPAQSSPLEPMSKLAPAALARVQTKKLMAVEPLDVKADGVRVLARWNTSEAPPAVIEKRLGRGSVLLWLTPADKSWGDWPLDPTYVLAVRSAVVATVRDDAARSNATVGPAISLPAKDATAPTARGPGGDLLPASVHDNAVVLEHTAQAGVYAIGWKDAQGKPQSRNIAAAPDRAESDLRPISDDQLGEAVAPLKPTILHYTGVASLADRGREIWRTLATIVLSLFVIEMCLATWVGRQR
ncbi:MAG: BatA domain-containing protein [Tepidisphaeraceae bacterium]